MALAAVVGLVAGCRILGVDRTPTPAASTTPVSSPTIAPVDVPVSLHVQLGAGQTLTTRPSQPDGCPGFDALVRLAPDRFVRLSAFAAGCTVADNGRPGNGRHGVYRTTADVPADRLAAASTVHTALGDAVVFIQPYYECTNSCRFYTEPVAVITLDHPRDPAYPALMAYSEKGTVGFDDLKAVVRDQLTR